MKTGVILYVTGDRIQETETVEKKSIKDLVPYAEVVHLASNLEEIFYYWFMLTVKGMHSIKCLVAERQNQNNLRLTGREMRLYG